jgi:DNA modification methylase
MGTEPSLQPFLERKTHMKKSEMQWKDLPIDQLKPATYNPRKKLKPGDKEYEKIKNSIKEFGYVEPIIVNYDMTVIGGHQRLTVLKDLGYETVQCVQVHIEDEHKVKALNVALNKITGAWDEQLLADLLVDLKSVDFNVDLTGFEAPEVEQLFSKVHSKDVKEDDFDVEEELQKPTFSKTGDIWHLGEHRVICGDATLPETYHRLMDGKKANLVLTDPPYNVNVEETAGKIKNDNMPDDKFYQFLFCAFVNMEQNMESDASIYVFHADTQGYNFRKAFKDAGFYLSGCCIWKKNALVLGRSPYQWQHEPCLFGWKLGGRHQWYSDRKQTTIWEYDRPKSSKDHPTMKPIALMAYPIRNSSMSHCIVLDPFLGSGSTLMACVETDRICYGIELDEKFVDVIVRRYVKEKGPDGVFVERDEKRMQYSEAVNET